MVKSVKKPKKKLWVPANNLLKAGMVPANNFLKAGTVPTNNFLKEGTVPANNHILIFICLFEYLNLTI